MLAQHCSAPFQLRLARTQLHCVDKSCVDAPGSQLRHASWQRGAHRSHHHCTASTAVQPRTHRKTSPPRLEPSRALSSVEGGGADSVQHAVQQPEATSLGGFLYALYKFSRPHTMLGTAISVTSISLLAWQSHVGGDLAAAATGLAVALVSALLMNIAIVGLNQISDIEIDKVNKPELPLASGEMRPATAWLLVLGSAGASLVLGQVAGSAALQATLLVSLALGVAYSWELPFLRWKRSPLLAAGCILAVRALIVQLGFWAHMQTCLAAAAGGLSAGAAAGVGLLGASLTPPILFTVSFMLLFSVVIALFKDIPDAAGDRGAGLRTLTVQHGPQKVFWTCIWLLTAAYAGAICYSLFAAASTATNWSASSLLAGLQLPLGPLAPAPAPLPLLPLPPAPLHSAPLHPAPQLLPLVSMSLSSAGVIGARTLACVSGHCLAVALLWRTALATDLSKKSDITAAYMHVWKLFYAEYILIPLLL
ncbi:UbiA prenyltransferase family-domain-containing protein [Haematococcus lacustris]